MRVIVNYRKKCHYAGWQNVYTILVLPSLKLENLSKVLFYFGATTLSIMTLSISTLSITINLTRHSA
jgi:hypothetical protein